MAFVKGKSGNPGGRSTEKVWRDAVLKAIRERNGAKGPQFLEIAAKALVAAAASGDVSALKEIGDRLDGKSPQNLPDGTASILGHLIIDDGYGRKG